MRLTDVLRQEAEQMYAATGKLFSLVEGEDLAWKPATGKNWMTVGQVMHHCTNACGFCIKGFVTGDWGLGPDAKMEDVPPEAALPPAEKMPTVGSVAEAKELLAEDRAMAMRYIEEAGEEKLLGDRFAAPWGGPEVTLFQHLYTMIWHLGQHKGQLFYYLKLMGRDVNTRHLWGV